MSAPIQLKETNSVRERIDPTRGDSDYIHLADLIAALKEFATDKRLKILDFGCGDSPYRTLFSNAEYLRADFPGTEVDYEIGARSLVNEADAQFDLVLSTQVAEHVEDSASYFAESYRLLRPGGRFICTTHGMYPDHSCPYDFQRWTAEGLNRDIAAAGFEITRTLKLTTNGRAIMYLVKRFSGWLDATGTGSRSISFRALRSLLQRRAKDWHRVADRLFPKNRIVEGSDESQVFYIGLLVAAVKPETATD